MVMMKSKMSRKRMVFLNFHLPRDRVHKIFHRRTRLICKLNDEFKLLDIGYDSYIIKLAMGSHGSQSVQGGEYLISFRASREEIDKVREARRVFQEYDQS